MLDFDPSRRPSFAHLFSGLALLAVSLMVLSGCPESNNAVCGTDQDCQSGQECLDGVCKAPSSTDCSLDSDCPGGYFCENNQCKLESDQDVNPSDADDEDTGGQPDDTGMDAGEDADTAPDETPPTVTSVTPSAGSAEVARDTEITIEFSEPMRDLALRKDSVKLIDPNGETVEIQLDKSDLQKVTLTPTEPLHAISPYRIVVTEDAQDQAMNQLADAPFTATFTTDWDEPAALRDLAKKWAPWVYQDLAETSGTGANNDIPTTINFDGDMDATNNEENARKSGGTAPKAHVYYHVTSSETHHFLFYLLYYPSRKASGQDEHTEHHYGGAVFVVDKASDELVLVDGLRLRPSGPLWLSFTSEESGIDEVGQYSSLIKVEKDNWKLEDGSHYPMFVKSGNHETCHWYNTGIPGAGSKCAHRAGEFTGSAKQGVVLKPGNQANTYAEATTDQNSGLKTAQYKLIPFVEHFWAWRTMTGQSELFSGIFEYKPNSSDSSRPKGYPGEENHWLPKSLSTPDGDAVAQTPFRWESFANEEGDGQWILDPAYVTDDRFDLRSLPSFSDTYCYNLFFEIDERSSTMMPSCAPEMGGDAGMGDAGTPDAGDAGDTGPAPDAGN